MLTCLPNNFNTANVYFRNTTPTVSPRMGLSGKALQEHPDLAIELDESMVVKNEKGDYQPTEKLVSRLVNALYPETGDPLHSPRSFAIVNLQDIFFPAAQYANYSDVRQQEKLINFCKTLMADQVYPALIKKRFPNAAPHDFVLPTVALALNSRNVEPYGEVLKTGWHPQQKPHLDGFGDSTRLTHSFYNTRVNTKTNHTVQGYQPHVFDFMQLAHDHGIQDFNKIMRWDDNFGMESAFLKSEFLEKLPYYDKTWEMKDSNGRERILMVGFDNTTMGHYATHGTPKADEIDPKKQGLQFHIMDVLVKNPADYWKNITPPLLAAYNTGKMPALR